MTERNHSISEVDLHAYVDHQLDTERRAEIDLFLKSHPETSQKVHTCQQINQGLQGLFDDVMNEPIPERLKDAGKPSRKGRTYFQIAAMAASLVIGTGIGWLARDGLEQTLPPQQTALVDSAFTAHVVYTPEVRHPVEVGAEEEKHLVGWLSKRLKTKIQAPQLSSLGYELLGGRLLAADREPAAQFMYQNPEGNRLTLYVRHMQGPEQDTAFQYARQNGTQGFYWVDGNLGYALIGDVGRSLISKAAYIVYEELNR